MVKCAKVEREQGETVRRKLLSLGVLDGGHEPCRDAKCIYFPVKGNVPAALKLAVVEKKCKKREGFARPFAAELEGKLTAKEREELVKSFDNVGDIAVIEVPDALVAKEKLIAEAIMKQQHSVRVVAKKVAGTSGEFRIRPVEVIAGEKRTNTIYREGGCSFELDLNKTYFSPRLGTERGRLCELVKEGESVLVPFAGVGPFAIRIAKSVPSAKVVGIELNPDAAEYFRKNVARNKCANVVVEEGDAEKIMLGKYKGWADRIAMPLPKDASHFLPSAIAALRKGGMLHYYAFGKISAPYDEAEKQAKEAAAKLKRKAVVVFRRIVRPYSRDTVQIVLDVRID